MDQAAVISLLEEALEVNSGTVSMGTVIADVEAWDSVGWMAIIALLDERCGVRIDSKLVLGFEQAGDVIAHILERAKLPS